MHFPNKSSHFLRLIVPFVFNQLQTTYPHLWQLDFRQSLLISMGFCLFSRDIEIEQKLARLTAREID